jgi:hypothetical protein
MATPTAGAGDELLTLKVPLCMERHSDHDPVLRTVRNPRAAQPKRLCPALELTGKEDPLGVGLLALCIQQDGLDEPLLNVKSERPPEGPLAP